MSSGRRADRVHAIFVMILALFVSLSAAPSVAAALTPVLVKSIDSTGNSNLTNFTVVGSKFYFTVNDATAKRNELWVSDGTTPGTQLVKSIDSTGNANLSDFTVVGSKLYFTVNDATAKRNELWVSDGTTLGTRLVKNIDPAGNLKFTRFTVAGSKLYFLATDAIVDEFSISTRYELWVSDGTSSGTQKLRDFILPKPDSEFGGITVEFGEITVIGSKLYFFVGDSARIDGNTTHGTQLWASDGTISGTKMVRNINPTNSSCCADGAEGVGNDFFIALGSKFLFTATKGTPGNELWSSDGTEAGTRVIAVVNPNVWKTLTFGAIVVGSKLYFDVSNGKGAGQLWVSNGTAAGTKMVKEINPKGGAYFGNFNAIGSNLYFNASDGIHGNELWISNGTASGTRMVKDINPKGNSNIGRTITSPTISGAWGSKLYFTATDGAHGNELWTSDGTSTGTKMVKDINPKGDSDITDPTVIGKRLYFTADDGIHGNELWVSDGTARGTYMLKDINAKGDSIILEVAATNSTFFFDATTSSDIGFGKLWSTDGTTAGTQQVKFGTAAGTRLVGEIVLRSAFYLWADDGTHRNGLWKIGK